MTKLRFDLLPEASETVAIDPTTPVPKEAGTQLRFDLLPDVPSEEGEVFPRNEKVVPGTYRIGMQMSRARSKWENDDLLRDTLSAIAASPIPAENNPGVVELSKVTGTPPHMVAQHWQSIKAIADRSVDPKKFREEQPYLYNFILRNPWAADTVLREKKVSFISKYLGDTLSFDWKMFVPGGFLYRQAKALKEIALDEPETQPMQEFEVGEQQGVGKYYEQLSKGMLQAGVAPLANALADVVEPVASLVGSDFGSGLRMHDGDLATLGWSAQSVDTEIYNIEKLLSNPGINDISKENLRAKLEDLRHQKHSIDMGIVKLQQQVRPADWGQGPTESLVLDSMSAVTTQVASLAGMGTGAAVGAAVGFGIAGPAGAGAGAKVGGLGAGFLTTYFLERGSTWPEMRDMVDEDGNKVDIGTAAAWNNVAAAAKAIVEVGADAFLVTRALGPAGELMLKGETRAAMRAMMGTRGKWAAIKDIGSRWFTGSGAEGGEEFMQAGIDIIAKWGTTGKRPDYDEAMAEMVHAGIIGAIGGGLVTSSMVPFHIATQAIEWSKIRRAGMVAEGIAELSGVEGVRDMPVEFSEMFTKMAKDKGLAIEGVFLSPLRLQEVAQEKGVDLDLVVDKLLGPDGKKQFAEAVAAARLAPEGSTKATLKVDTATFIKEWAPLNLLEGFSGDITVAAGTLTPREEAQNRIAMLQRLPEMEKQIAEADKEAGGWKPQSPAERALYDAVETSMRKAVERTGDVLSQEQIDATMRMHRARARVFADRTQYTEEEILEHLAIDFGAALHNESPAKLEALVADARRRVADLEVGDSTEDNREQLEAARSELSFLERRQEAMENAEILADAMSTDRVVESSLSDEALDIAERVSDALISQDDISTYAGPRLDAEVVKPPTTKEQWQNFPQWETRVRAWMEHNGYTKDEITRHIGAMRGQFAIFSSLAPFEMDFLPRTQQAVKSDWSPELVQLYDKHGGDKQAMREEVQGIADEKKRKWYMKELAKVGDSADVVWPATLDNIYYQANGDIEQMYLLVRDIEDKALRKECKTAMDAAVKQSTTADITRRQNKKGEWVESKDIKPSEFGVLRKNADAIYKLSFDLSAMCRKRLQAGATLALITQRLNEKRKARGEKPRGLRENELFALANLFRIAGKEAPCLYCYVEAPRAAIAGMLTNALKIAAGDSTLIKTQENIDAGIVKAQSPWADSLIKLAHAAQDEFREAGIDAKDLPSPLYWTDPDAMQDEALRAEWAKFPALFRFAKKQVDNAKSNKPKLYSEYWGHILKLDQSFIDYTAEHAGFRFFSSSDFQFEHVVDLMQAIHDLALRKAKSHAYTKVKEYVEIFGDTQQKIQTSLFALSAGAARQTEDGKWVVYERGSDGKLTDKVLHTAESQDDAMAFLDEYMPAGGFMQDAWQGMDWETAFKYREQFDHVGNVFIATSSAQIRWALDNDKIDYIIPFHASGMKGELFKSEGYINFTSQQEEQWAKPAEEGAPAMPWNKWAKKVAPEGSVNKVRMHELGALDGISNEEMTKNYLRLCEERGLEPVFSKFAVREDGSFHPQFSKLKKDYARSDTPFLPVRAFKEDGGDAINTEAASRVMREFVEFKKEVDRDPEGLRSKLNVPAAIPDIPIAEQMVELADEYDRNGTDPFEVTQALMDGMPVSAGKRIAKLQLDLAAGVVGPTREQSPSERLDAELKWVSLAPGMWERDQWTITKGKDGWNLYDNFPRGFVDSFASQKLAREAAAEFEAVARGERPPVAQVDTPEFKKWFEGSKAQVGFGRPKVLYHGSGTPGFDVIDVEKSSDIGFHVGTREAAEDRLHDVGELFIRAEESMTEIGDPEEVQAAIEAGDVEALTGFLMGDDTTVGGRPEYGGEFVNEGMGVYPVYIAVKKPLRLPDLTSWEPLDVLRAAHAAGAFTTEEAEALGMGDSRVGIGQMNRADGYVALRKALEEKGYDGIVYTNRTEAPGSESWIVWHSEQVKSAIGNRGSFDPKRPSILEQGGLQTETPEFKKWFGGSEIVDKNGNPLRLYHGTAAQNIESFETPPNFPPGFYFTAKPRTAGNYAVGSTRAESGGPNIIPAYLNISKPLRVVYEETIPGLDMEWMGNLGGGLKEKIEAMGYDGVIAFYDKGDMGNLEAAAEFVAFKPTQIKSAIGNRGTFDPNNPSIVEQSDKVRTPRGYMRPIQKAFKKTFQIFLKKNSDVSTPLHEMAHAYFEMLHDLATLPPPKIEVREVRGKTVYELVDQFTGKAVATFDNAAEAEVYSEQYLPQQESKVPPQIKHDYGAILSWLGAKNWGSLTTEQHERFARAFEKYLYEGNAPSLSLVSTFARIKAWLFKIYRDGRELNVEIDDTIRGVFDRMLATDEEIQLMRASMGIDLPFFATAKQAGMTPKQFEEYKQERDQQLAKQAHRAYRLAMEAQRDTLKQEWQKELAENRKVAQWDYRKRKDYRAARYIRKNEYIDSTGGMIEGPPFDGRLDREAVRALVGKNTPVERSVRNATVEGGRHPDDVATMFGFENGKDMLVAIATMPKESDYVREFADQLTAEDHPDMQEEIGRLDEIVGKALHDEGTTEALLREWRIINTKAGRGSMQQLAIEQHAKNVVAQTPINDLRPAVALGRERTFADKAIAAAAKGDFNAAADAKLQQLINHYLYRELVKAKEERTDGTKVIRDMGSKKVRERLGKAGATEAEPRSAYLDVTDSLTEKLLGVEHAHELPRLGVTDLVQQIELDGGTVAFEPSVLEAFLANPKPLSKMTMAEFREAVLTLRNIRANAAKKTSATLDNKKVEMDEAAQLLVSEAEENLPQLGGIDEGGSVIDTVLHYHREFSARLLRQSTMVRWLSARDTNSAWHKLILRPLREAEKMKMQLMREVVKPIVEAFDALPENVRKHMNDRIDTAKLFPNHKGGLLKGPSRRYHLLVMALNVGTQDVENGTGNLERLCEGRNITEDQVMNALRTLTLAEWKWVQSVWDANEKLWPMIRDLEMRDSGLPPERIPLRAFTIKTSDGETFSSPGGYVPAVYDRRAATNTNVVLSQGIGSLMDQTHERPGTSRGHTKARARKFSDVISLEPGAFKRGLAQAAHDLAFREPIRQVGALLLRQDVESALQTRLGPERTQSFLDWARAVGNDNNDNTAAPPHMLMKLRTNAMTAILGHRVKTMAGDFANWFAAAPELKRYWPHGFRQMLTNPKHWVEFAEKRSTWLTTARSTLDVEYNLIQEQFKRRRDPLSRVYHAFKDSAWWGFEQTFKLTAYPMWVSAYQMYVEQGMTEEDAAYAADDMCAKYFPSTTHTDQSGIQRDKGWAGFSMMFFGYINSIHQMNADAAQELYTIWKMTKGHHGQKAWNTAKALPAVAGHLIAFWTASVVIGELFTGRGPDKDEPWSEWYARKLMMGVISPIPFVGYSIESLILGKPASVRTAPALSAFDSVTLALKKVAGAKPGAFMAALKAAGMLLGIPVSPLEQMDYFLSEEGFSRDLDQGDVFGMVDGAMYGKRKKWSGESIPHLLSEE